MNEDVTPKPAPVRCMFAIEGPSYGRRVVAWRKYCKRLTTHESGRCYQHR